MPEAVWAGASTPGGGRPKVGEVRFPLGSPREVRGRSSRGPNSAGPYFPAPVRNSPEKVRRSVAQKQFFVGKHAREFQANKTLRLQAFILVGFWAKRRPVQL